MIFYIKIAYTYKYSKVLLFLLKKIVIFINIFKSLLYLHMGKNYLYLNSYQTYWWPKKKKIVNIYFNLNKIVFSSYI